MRIIYNKKKEGYLLFPQVTLKGYNELWNPLTDQSIKKEHLKLFFEKALQKNFLSYHGAWFGFFLDQRCYTALTDELEIFNLAFNEYLFKKENLEEKEISHPFSTFVLDSSELYKPFAHLLSNENFSFLLREMLYELHIFPSWHQENLIDFLFISDRTLFKTMVESGEEWIPTDKNLWNSILNEREKWLAATKKTDSVEKFGDEVKQEVQNLDKYLY